MLERGQSPSGRFCIPHGSSALLALVRSSQGAFTGLVGTAWLQVREVITALLKLLLFPGETYPWGHTCRCRRLVWSFQSEIEFAPFLDWGFLNLILFCL